MGLPAATPTPKPKNLVPALTHAYQSLHLLRSLESVISHIVNKDCAISTALLNFRNAYQNAKQQYQQTPTLRSILRKAVSRSDSEPIPDSALLEDYLLRKLNERAALSLSVHDDGPWKGFSNHSFGKGGDTRNWCKCLVWGC